MWRLPTSRLLVSSGFEINTTSPQIKRRNPIEKINNMAGSMMYWMMRPNIDIPYSIQFQTARRGRFAFLSTVDGYIRRTRNDSFVSLNAEGVLKESNQSPHTRHYEDGDNTPKHELDASLAVLILPHLGQIFDETPDEDDERNGDKERHDRRKDAVHYIDGVEEACRARNDWCEHHNGRDRKCRF